MKHNTNTLVLFLEPHIQDKIPVTIFKIMLFLLSIFCIPTPSFATLCSPGTTCTGLPPEVGPQKFRMDTDGVRHDQTWLPEWTTINSDPYGPDNGDIIGEGWFIPGFDANKTDPSWGDDSFYYYLHVDKYRTYYQYDRIFQQLNNSCCSPTGPNPFTVTYTSSYTYFENSTIQSELSSKFSGAAGEIGSKISVSQTFGQSWTSSVTTGQTFNVTLDCCSGEAWWNQYKVTELVLDIGYQEDVLGGWNDKYYFDASLVDTSWIGTYRDTVSGKCVAVPEPQSFLILGIGFISLWFTRKRNNEFLHYNFV